MIYPALRGLINKRVAVFGLNRKASAAAVTADALRRTKFEVSVFVIHFVN